MKTKGWSKRILLIVLFTVTIGSMSFISKLHATPPYRALVSQTKLKLGTYKALGVVETITSGYGAGYKYTIPLKIKIVSIDKENNVKAEFIRNNQVGRLKGRIDATGKLQLEGYLNDPVGAEYHVFLTATVDDVLTDGKYTMKSSVETKGVFPTSELEDDN
jgi:hypothetical protein